MKTDTRYCWKCDNYLDPSVQPKEHDHHVYCSSCYDSLLIAKDKPARAIIIDDVKTPPIGESAPTTRCDDVNVPLDLQRRLLHSSFYDTALWLLEVLEDEEFLEDVEQMAEARLEEAHPKWGSTMYSWDGRRRFRAIMEELADIFVYRSSGG